MNPLLVPCPLCYVGKKIPCVDTTQSNKAGKIVYHSDTIFHESRKIFADGYVLGVKEAFAQQENNNLKPDFIKDRCGHNVLDHYCMYCERAINSVPKYGLKQE